MASNPNVLSPVVIELGKKRRKPLKELARGRGKLVDDVNQVVERVRAELGDQARGKEFVPVVVVFQKKSRKRQRMAFPLPCTL
jgi:hypothetical protein